MSSVRKFYLVIAPAEPGRFCSYRPQRIVAGLMAEFKRGRTVTPVGCYGSVGAE